MKALGLAIIALSYIQNAFALGPSTPTPENIIEALRSEVTQAQQINSQAHTDTSWLDKLLLGPSKGKTLVVLEARPPYFDAVLRKIRDLKDRMDFALKAISQPDQIEALQAAFNRELLRVSDTFLLVYREYLKEIDLTGRSYLDARFGKRVMKQVQLIGLQDVADVGYWESKEVALKTLETYSLKDSADRGENFARLSRSQANQARPSDSNWLDPLLKSPEAIRLAVYFIASPSSHGYADFPTTDSKRLFGMLLDGRLTPSNLADFEALLLNFNASRNQMIDRHWRDPSWFRTDGTRFTNEERFFGDLETLLSALPEISERAKCRDLLAAESRSLSEGFLRRVRLAFR